MPRKPTPKTRVARGREAADVPPIAIIVSRYNESITDPLLIGAIEAYERAGGDSHTIHVVQAPGAYELPIIALAAAESGRFAGVVALGCVIRGQTRHDRYISQAVARGLMDVSLHTRLPITFGVLTVENARQARDRAGGSRGNKGAEAMRACLASIAALESLGMSPAIGEAQSAADEAGPKPTVIDEAPDKARRAGGRR